MTRTYSKLITLPDIMSRYNYLKLSRSVGARTFGSDRFLNQDFYKSREWKHIRDFVIVRDKGCDLGLLDFPIGGKILVHHMNPMSLLDVKFRNEDNLNPEFLISSSERTHQAIHYGDKELLPSIPVLRVPNDTRLW